MQKVLGLIVIFGALGLPAPMSAQSLGNAGTVEGTVVDPSGAAVPRASIEIHNPITGYTQRTVTDAGGSFRFLNVPPNPYHIQAAASGFATAQQDLTVRTAIPVSLHMTLSLAGERSTVTVEAAGADVLEVDPSAHTDADRTLILKLPAIDPAGGLSQAITYSTGGVAADANGLFHPVGDHSQSSFVVDGQPISDQQSKVFSTQLPTTAIQSMEIVTGTPDAEFGDKSSLIANITTRSGLGADHTFGNVDATYGSFGTMAAVNAKPEDFRLHLGKGSISNEGGAKMAMLASLLSNNFNRPVVDETGLTGFYQFHLTWAPDSAVEAAGPSLATALQEQLGLRLETARRPVDVIVIDRIERPSEN